MAGFTPVANQLRIGMPDAIGVDQLKQRNALADRSMAVQEQNAQSYQNQLGMTQENMRRNWLAQDKNQQLADDQRSATEAHTLALYASQAKTPEEFKAIAQRMGQNPLIAQALAEQGASWEQLQPSDVHELLAMSGAKAGVAPDKPFEGSAKQQELDYENNLRLAQIRENGRQARLTTAAKPDAAGQKAPSGYMWAPDGRSLVAVPGGPADPERPKPPSPQDLKARRDAQARIPTVDAAIRRVDRLSAAVDSIAKNSMFDGGPADAKVLKYTKQGQEVTQSAASLMPALTALTRVPGIGSQSDLEQRLAQLQLPSLEFAPEVNAKAMDELKQFVADLKRAYQTAATGEQVLPDIPNLDSAAPAAPAKAPVRTISAGGWKVTPVQ